TSLSTLLPDLGPSELYTLSLHDALPISAAVPDPGSTCPKNRRYQYRPRAQWPGLPPQPDPTTLGPATLPPPRCKIPSPLISASSSLLPPAPQYPTVPRALATGTTLTANRNDNPPGSHLF